MQEKGNNLEKQRAQEKRIEAQRAEMITQILTTEARERLERIRIVRPSDAVEIEAYLIRLAQSGYLTASLSDAQLLEILQNSATEKTEETIIKRRNDEFEDDFDVEEFL